MGVESEGFVPGPIIAYCGPGSNIFDLFQNNNISIYNYTNRKNK